MFRRFAAGIFKAWGNLSKSVKKGRTAVEAVPADRLRWVSTGLSLGTVASPQSRLPFHPAGL